MSVAELAHAPGEASAILPCDRELSEWQGRIAIAAANGGGLDVYRAALSWAKQCVPPDNGVREKAKRELRDAAERHLGDSAAVLEAIYFDIFPEDVEQDCDASAANRELDAEVIKLDVRNETDAEIKRLAKLTQIEYERERKSAAEKLGIDRVSVLDAAVKSARRREWRYQGARAAA